MSGLIQRAEYDRVVRERDMWKERCQHRESLFAVDDLQAHIRALLLSSRGRAGVAGGWGMSAKAPAAIAATLMKAYPATVSRDGLLEHCPDSDRPKTVDVHVHKLRMWLKAAGAPEGTIKCSYGVGFFMSTEGRAWLSQAIQPQAEGRSP